MTHDPWRTAHYTYDAATDTVTTRDGLESLVEFTMEEKRAMNQARTLRLPWPPSLNKYYRSVGGKVLVSKEGRNYRHDVIMLAAAKPLEGRIGVRIDCFPPDKRRRDLDNLCKGLLDAMQHAGQYVDDSQIDDLQLRRQSVAGPDGYVEVKIWEVDE